MCLSSSRKNGLLNQNRQMIDRINAIMRHDDLVDAPTTSLLSTAGLVSGNQRNKTHSLPIPSSSAPHPPFLHFFQPAPFSRSLCYNVAKQRATRSRRNAFRALNSRHLIPENVKCFDSIQTCRFFSSAVANQRNCKLFMCV